MSSRREDNPHRRLIFDIASILEGVPCRNDLPSLQRKLLPSSISRLDAAPPSWAYWVEEWITVGEIEETGGKPEVFILHLMDSTAASWKFTFDMLEDDHEASPPLPVGSLKALTNMGLLTRFRDGKSSLTQWSPFIAEEAAYVVNLPIGDAAHSKLSLSGWRGGLLAMKLRRLAVNRIHARYLYFIWSPPRLPAERSYLTCLGTTIKHLSCLP